MKSLWILYQQMLVLALNNKDKKDFMLPAHTIPRNPQGLFSPVCPSIDPNEPCMLPLQRHPYVDNLACQPVKTFKDHALGFGFLHGFFLAFLVMLLSPFQSLAAEQQTITSVSVAAEDNWPPFADQFGKGISHTLLNAAYGQVGIKVEYLVVPYARALRMAEKGTVDGVFNVAKEISTQNKFIFGQQALFTTSASFYQSNQKPTSATHKSQLAPHTVVGIIEGYEYGDEFSKLVSDNQLTIFTATSQKQLINLLLVNRIDLAVIFDLVAKVHLSQMGAEQDISPAFTNHSSDIYVAFSKQSPNAHYLAQKLDEGLLKLKSQGQYATLLLPSAE
jgi:polar amino acid transport system substrate-binding protein